MKYDGVKEHGVHGTYVPITALKAAARHAGFTELGIAGARLTLTESPDITAPCDTMNCSASVKEDIEFSDDSSERGIRRPPIFPPTAGGSTLIEWKLSRNVGNSLMEYSAGDISILQPLLPVLEKNINLNRRGSHHKIFLLGPMCLVWVAIAIAIHGRSSSELSRTGS